MKKIGFVVAVAAVALFASQAVAAENPFSAARKAKPGSVGQAIPGAEPPGDPVNLQVDDGSMEDSSSS
jgi:hypothetical protein